MKPSPATELDHAFIAESFQRLAQGHAADLKLAAEVRLAWEVSGSARLVDAFPQCEGNLAPEAEPVEWERHGLMWVSRIATISAPGCRSGRTRKHSFAVLRATRGLRVGGAGRRFR